MIVSCNADTGIENLQKLTIETVQSGLIDEDSQFGEESFPNNEFDQDGQQGGKYFLCCILTLVL